MFQRLLTPLLLCQVVLASPAFAQDSTVTPKPLSVRLVDADGKPVPGALVGNVWRTWLSTSHAGVTTEHFSLRRMVEFPRVGVFGDSIPRGFVSPLAADDSGDVQTLTSELFCLHKDGPQIVAAMSPDAHLVGFVTVSPDEAPPKLTITLQPVVTRQIICINPLVSQGGDAGTTATFSLPGGGDILDHMAAGAIHTVSLPAGKYRVEAYGTKTFHTETEIEFGDDLSDVTVELQPVPLALLENKPAPELTNIKAWFRGEPFTLEEAEGKVVLLDFFGYWCGPCVMGMPKLFELHDRYHERGLVVAGIHDDSVGSVADLEPKLAPFREKLWNGRDFPFAVAIDGSEKATDDQPSFQGKTKGSTTKAYGVFAFPTYVLIDRKGNVRGSFHQADHSDAIKLLETLLAEPTD